MEEFHEEEKQQKSQNPQYNIEEINNQVDVQNSNEFSKHSIEETIRIGFIRKVMELLLFN